MSSNPPTQHPTLPLRTRKTLNNPALASKLASLSLTLSPLVALPAGDPHPSFPRTLLAYHLLSEDELDGLAHWYHQSTPSEWTGQYPAAMNWDREWLDAGRYGKTEEAGRLADRGGRGRGMRRRSSILGLGGAAVDSSSAGVDDDATGDWYQRALDAASASKVMLSTATANASSASGDPQMLASPMELTSPMSLISPMTLTSPTYSNNTPASPTCATPASTTTLSPPLATPTRRSTSAHTRPLNAATLTDTERIAIKRRKVGKFIGLIGMETPDEEIEARMMAAMERAIQRGREELREVEEWSMRRRKVG